MIGVARDPRHGNSPMLLFLVGFAAVFTGLVLQGLGVLVAAFVPTAALEVLAVALTSAATVLAFWAQDTMGAAWLADITPADAGELVTAGPFAVVRNPSYVAMSTAILGALCVAANACVVGGWMLVLAGLAATARAEESELVAAYGQPYRDYAARVGRFMPFTGRLRS